MPEETNTTAQPVPQQPISKSPYGIPVAIVIAAMFIAGAIVYTGGNRSGTQVGNPVDQNAQATKEIEVPPVTEKDHIRGNPNAPIVIVEYSDYECPFCKNFHETMQKIMSDYGKDGKVAWVYRQFPLEQLHPNAPKIAEASECVASIGGNDAFWKFTDLVFGQRQTNEFTNMDRLPEYAETSGVSKAAYTQCMASGKFKDVIVASGAEALKTGARGTPYSILIAGNQQGPINGAQPYTVVKQMIETILKQVGTK